MPSSPGAIRTITVPGRALGGPSSPMPPHEVLEPPARSTMRQLGRGLRYCPRTGRCRTSPRTRSCPGRLRTRTGSCCRPDRRTGSSPARPPRSRSLRPCRRTDRGRPRPAPTASPGRCHRRARTTEVDEGAGGASAPERDAEGRTSPGAAAPFAGAAAAGQGDRGEHRDHPARDHASPARRSCPVCRRPAAHGAPVLPHDSAHPVPGLRRLLFPAPRPPLPAGPRGGARRARLRRRGRSGPGGRAPAPGGAVRRGRGRAGWPGWRRH
ncbi:hypothetical protein SHIRM173S_08460 [Streptomyces hirsutus]